MPNFDPWNFEPPTGPTGYPDDLDNWFSSWFDLAGVQSEIETFETLPLGQYTTSSGIADAPGGDGTGTWNVVAGGLIEGSKSSQINSTAASAWNRHFNHSNTGAITYFCGFSLSAQPTGTTPILRGTQGISTNTAIAAVCINSSGNFFLRDGLSASGTTYPFQTGKIYQLVYYIDLSGGTQACSIYSQYGVLIATITGSVTQPKLGMDNLTWGLVSNPGVACVATFDYVGYIMGATPAMPLTPTDPGSPSWVFTPPGSVGSPAPNAFPVTVPAMGYSWNDVGQNITAPPYVVVVDELTWHLNRLAQTLTNGTTGLPTLEAVGAANRWAGTTGMELVGALNVKAGNAVGSYKELAGVLNQIAGTTGLEPPAAAGNIAS